MMRIRSFVSILLVIYAVFGGAVINQLHNHEFHACDGGHVEHTAPCPVSVFFANFAGETATPILPATDATIVGIIAVEPQQIDFGFALDIESSRAPPLA